MREKTEWIHYESQEGNKKILIIGDSILWGSHRYIEKALPDGFALTTVTTAHGVSDEQFVGSIAMLATLNDTDYEAVYFNNGLHARGQSAEEYERNYDRVLNELTEAIPAKKWILGLSTPISDKQTDAWDHTAPIDNRQIESLQKANELVREFNEKVIRIAKQRGLPYYDAYAFMEGRNELKVDPYHYSLEGRELLANAVCTYILKEIGEG